jgi:hypothetical protein
MNMQLTTIDLTNPTLDTTAIVSTKTSTTTMVSYGLYKDVAMFQAIGGYLPNQEPFAVGLTVNGYFGMTLGGQSMGSMIPLENSNSIIEGAEDRSFRSRFRNHNDQVVPDYEEPKELIAEKDIGPIFGFIAGVFVFVGVVRSLIRRFKRRRLVSEERCEESNTYELIARLQQTSESQSGDGGISSDKIIDPTPPLSVPAIEQPFVSTSAHTLSDELGLMRHPRPNTVITIGDDNEPSPILEYRHTQAS